MAGVSKLRESQAFDAESYCAIYPDIAQALAEGRLLDPWEHYDRHGRSEGRTPCRFDENFYLRAYPDATHMLATGAVTTALQHYVDFGRARGFLPHAGAKRPADATVGSSAFGGLWIDRADALDRIKGRLETGRITQEQAERLTCFATNGYVTLSSAIEPSVVDAAKADLETAFNGGFSQMQFQVPGLAANTHWKPGVERHASKALDPHHFSSAIRRLIFAPAIAGFLELIFDSKALASQSLGFWRGSGQRAHQDTIYVAYSLARQFAASWVALEDVKIGAGELFYYPGSHRLPDFLHGGQYKSISELMRMGCDPNEARAQARRHEDLLEQWAERFGLAKQVLIVKKGDVLIWHADLIHGGNPVSPDSTRKSIVTHYCPKYVVPLFCEQHEVTFHEHDGHLFTSSHYAGFPPS